MIVGFTDLKHRAAVNKKVAKKRQENIDDKLEEIRDMAQKHQQMQERVRACA